MNDIDNNRRNLYDNLIGDGYFRGDDGEINYSFDEFCESLEDIDSVKTFYSNLLDDGYFRNEDGTVNLLEEDFLEMLGAQQPKRDYYPITENVRGVYIDWELNRDTTQYNIPEARIVRNVTAQQLRDALINVVEAHPYLKTHFAQRDGDIVQLRLDDDPVVVSITELQEKPTNDFFQSRVRPFHLLDGPLYRLEIYQTPTDTYLFTDFHHTIFDGASSIVFMQDLEKSLKGEKLKKEDYTAFDRALVEEKFWHTEACTEAEAYFDELLSDVNVTVYPGSHPENSEVANKSISFHVPSKEITLFCRNHNVTESNYFMTLFLQTLHRVTREDKVAITTIYHGRSDLKMLETMGMFVKTQPVVSVQTKENSGTTVSEAVLKIQQQILKTQSYDIYSFTKMVERYGLSAQIMYAFQGGMPIDTSDDRSEEEDIQMDLNTAKLPLSLSVIPASPSEYSLIIEYDTSIYAENDIQLLGRMLQAVCVDGTKDKAIRELSLLSDGDKQSVLSLSAGPVLDYDINETFIDMFHRQALATPDNIAVVDTDSQLSYSELDHRSDILAHLLISHGVRPDDFVCVMMERRKEFILCIHGIHKAAAAYTPLDIEYPTDRLQYMIDNSESKVLVTSHEVLDKKCKEEAFSVDESRTKIIYIDDVDFSVSSDPVNLCTPSNLAYMIYTSGSTGRPKGTMLHQAGLRNFIEVVKDMEKLTSSDRIESHRSFSFDAHIEDIYAVLTLGGSVHIMPNSIRKDLDAIHQFLLEHQITGGGYATAIGALLLNTYPDLPVRFITMGGEKLEGVYSDTVRIINVYGPTECTDDTSYYVVEPGEHVKNIPIGRSVGNSWSLIIDRSGNLVPQGVAGELCFAGIQVGRGYWHLPEKTSEVFGECPFVKEDKWGRKVRMYHTGDLARYNKDGELEYLGRIDNQVKLRGFRIELGEVESRAISFSETIKSVAAEVKEIKGTQHLCLYYVSGTEIDEESLKSYISETLTEYMVPEVFVRLDIMPMTPNGKIDRKALVAPSFVVVTENVSPATVKEETLYELAKQVLKTDDFGVTDDLTKLGMTSLLAIRFAMMANSSGIKIKVNDLLTQRTIRKVLTGVTTMACWINGYKTDCPIVVVVCGETSYKSLSPYIEALCEKFSVLVFEPITEHYEMLFSETDVDEVIEMYTALIDFLVRPQDKVSVFTGHCYGGEIAYKLAERWTKDHPGDKPLLAMLDVFWRIKEVQELEPLVRSLVSEQVINKLSEQFEYEFKLNRMYRKLGGVGTPAVFDCKKMLFRAMVPEPESDELDKFKDDFGDDFEQIKQLLAGTTSGRKWDNAAFWTKYYPDIEIHEVQADHMTMLTNEFVNGYVKRISEFLTNKK